MMWVIIINRFFFFFLDSDPDRGVGMASELCITTGVPGWPVGDGGWSYQM